MAYLKVERNLTALKLSGNDLPWVTSVKHLGIKIENNLNGMKQDMREKRAQFIQKNNEICQEFSFAHPRSKVLLNSIYNSHFTGSPTWDLFCRESEMIENTWNVAIRKMYNLDRKTHKYFIEPLSNRQHIKWSLIKRFINFIGKLSSSSKTPLTNLLHTIKSDCRSTTGRNLRHILKLMNADSTHEINLEKLKHLKYHEVDKAEEWRIQLVKELTDIKYNQTDLPGFNRTQINKILVHICIS